MLYYKNNQEFKLENKQRYITFSFLLIKYDFIILDFCISSILRQKDNNPSILTKKIKSKYSCLLAKIFKKHDFFDINEYYWMNQRWNEPFIFLLQNKERMLPPSSKLFQQETKRFNGVDFSVSKVINKKT